VRNNLKMGIVGLPNVGKSSLFNLLCEQSCAAVRTRQRAALSRKAHSRRRAARLAFWRAARAPVADCRAAYASGLRRRTVRGAAAA
jgi:hypothetical protein